MRTATRLVVAAAAGGLLAGCSVAPGGAPGTAPSSSPEAVGATADEPAVAVEPGGEEDAESAPAQAEDDAPEQVADLVASLPAEPLPEIAPATGTVVHSGAVSVTLPADHWPAGSYDGVHLFEGPTIPGARAARSGVQVYPPVVDHTWARQLEAWLRPGPGAISSEVYTLEIPGADAAVLHVVTDTEGHAAEDRDGRRVWQSPVTTAQVLVGVGDEVTRIVLQTAPTAEGLREALSVARSVTVAG
ncbi:MAG: hypothetical protein H5T83_13580 [Actinotalea sp.]|nr:hypothetical protein [Actinotalea sp.]